MRNEVQDLKLVSHAITCVLVGFISLLLMWKLITLHVSFGVAFLASLTLYLLVSFLTLQFEKSSFWENYLKEVEREFYEVEEYYKFLNNWLLKE